MAAVQRAIRRLNYPDLPRARQAPPRRRGRDVTERLLVTDVALLKTTNNIAVHIRMRGGQDRSLTLPLPQSAWLPGFAACVGLALGPTAVLPRLGMAAAPFVCNVPMTRTPISAAVIAMRGSAACGPRWATTSRRSSSTSSPGARRAAITASGFPSRWSTAKSRCFRCSKGRLPIRRGCAAATSSTSSRRQRGEPHPRREALQPSSRPRSHRGTAARPG